MLIFLDISNFISFSYVIAMPFSSQKFSRFRCWYYWWYEVKY